MGQPQGQQEEYDQHSGFVTEGYVHEYEQQQQEINISYNVATELDPTTTNVAPPQPQPDQYPPQQNPGQYPPQQNPGQYPSQQNPGQYPPQPNPAQYPPPGQQNYQTAGRPMTPPPSYPPPQGQAKPVQYPPPAEPVQFPPPAASQHQYQAPMSGQPPQYPPPQYPNQSPQMGGGGYPPQMGGGVGYGGGGGVPQSPMKPAPGIPMANQFQTPLASEQWRTGLFDCMDDPQNAIMTVCFPCVTFGQIAEIIDNGNTTCASNGFMYGCVAALIGVPCILSCSYRTKLRNRFALEELPGPDWLVHCLLEPCALCQEYRELNLRGLDPAIGWQGNLVKSQQQQQMGMMPPMNQTMNY